jgi:two-component system phosphate regulon response regulator PhoB
MPGLTGTEVLEKVRGIVEFSDIPVMMLTAHSSEDEKIAAIESGADDFLSKPYSEKELIVRIKALMRRSLMAQRLGQRRLRAGDLVVDIQRRQAFIKDAKIKLTNTEFRLLTELVKNTGEPVSRDRLRERALGHLDVNDRTIDVHILFLRRKLGKLGDQIETVRGHGYRFNLVG